jgi:DNA-binding GntR family transcriptional regulator
MSIQGTDGRADDDDRAAVGASTVETVYDAIKSDIISGKRKPEELLRIDRMSRAYGVGPTPLRETLQRLTAERLVIARGGRGFQVAPLTIAEFEDLNIARTAIELAALRLSLKHGNDAWEGRLVASGYMLQKLDAQMLQSPMQAIDRWELANANFHSTLLAGGPSRWLLRTQEGLGSKCERYRRVAIAKAGLPWHKDVAREHKELLAAALARDIDKSGELLTTHYQRTLEVVRNLLGQDPAASSYDA